MAYNNEATKVGCHIIINFKPGVNLMLETIVCEDQTIFVQVVECKDHDQFGRVFYKVGHFVSHFHQDPLDEVVYYESTREIAVEHYGPTSLTTFWEK